MNLTFGPSDQIVLIGSTGSGKSTFAAILTLAASRLVALDGKGTLTLPRASVSQLPSHDSPAFGAALKKALRWTGKEQRVILRVAPEDSDDLATHDAIFAEIYRTRPWFVWIDEISATGATASVCSKWLKALSARGRTLDIGLLTCTQSPFAMLPLILRRNAEVTMFGCVEPQDLVGIRRPGIEQAGTIEPNTGTFLVYRRGTLEPQLVQIAIPDSLKGWKAP